MSNLEKSKATIAGVHFKCKKTTYDKFKIRLIEENNNREEILEALIQLYTEKGEEILIYKK